MSVQRAMILLYIVLLALIVAQSIWWVIYLGREGEHYGNFQLQRLKTEQLHAAYLIQTIPELKQDPESQLGEAFPDLLFPRRGNSFEVIIDPAVEASIQSEVSRRQRMFMWEGAFFLILVLGGAFLVTLAYRRELAYKRARELFLAGVTHEFKTPLASLQLYTETLERSDLDRDKGPTILRHMEEDLFRLRAMVDQVLAASRAESPRLLRREPLDLAEQTEQTLAELAALLEGRGAVVEKKLSADCLILGDEQALRVAIRNLISNAVHYSPPEDLRLAVSLQTAGRRHRLSVSDSGPGIPRGEQKRIFKSFYRVGEAGSRPQGSYGTGLGLYLVKLNVEAMGGRVELASEPGRGSTFTLVFPVHRA